MAKMTQRKVARSDPHFPLPLSHPDLKSLGISITPRKLTLRQGARHLGAFGVLMSFNGSPDPAMPKCHSLCFASIAVKMLSGRHLKFKCRRGTLKSGPWEPAILDSLTPSISICTLGSAHTGIVRANGYKVGGDGENWIFKKQYDTVAPLQECYL